ncbi:MAG: sigma-70 family RNA polymerase sigma factor [Chloroflexi bacterium]|nr:sigma-70 family RNA polymerase sigma factor [Chloroflexota bacterium]
MQSVSSEESRLKTPFETALWTQAQAGCRQSVNLLMSQHNGLVYAVVRQQVLGDLSYDEALQAGRTGLWRAILGYDPERGTTFATYAWTAIMRSVWAAVKKSQKQERETFVLSESERLPNALRNAVQEPDKRWEQKALAAATRQAVRQLPPRLQFVLTARYGWRGNPPATFRQIGEQLGVSRQRAHQLHQEGLRRLRQPALSYQLRAWLGKHTAAEYEAAAAATALWRQKGGGRR